jgi:MFS family permease
VVAKPRSSAALIDNPVLVPLLLAVSISLTFQILLPVVPVMVEREGPHGIAGAATGALFLGAVTGELSCPWLMTIWRSRRLLVAGQLVTAIASLVYIVPGASTPLMISAAAVRGVGMGVAIVIATALVADLARPGRRGASIGYFGLALSVPGIFVPSIGVFFLASGRPQVDAVIGFVCSMVGALAALRVPDRAPRPDDASTSVLGAVRKAAIGTVFAGFVLASWSFGGSLTFVPIALPLSGLGSAATYFLVAGATRAAGRWLSGLLADRMPARSVLVGGVLLCLAGLVALAFHANTVVVLFAGFAYGAGYGTIQTAAYVAMLERGTARDSGAISALWNSGIDLGSSLGGTAIGVTAAQLGYGTAAWVLPAAVVASLPLFLLPARGAPMTTDTVAAVEPLPLEG